MNTISGNPSNSFCKIFISWLYLPFKENIHSNVDVLGFVVSRYTQHNRISYTGKFSMIYFLFLITFLLYWKQKVDDGSGVIVCNQWKNSSEEISNFIFELGSFVHIKGKVCFFRNEPKLTIIHMRLENDPNAESLYWLEVVNLFLKRNFGSLDVALQKRVYSSERFS